MHAVSYRAQVARLATEGDAAPFTMSSPDCAAVCVKALLAERPKARYRITLPTQAFWYLKRLLPTRWLDAVQRAAVGGQGKNH